MPDEITFDLDKGELTVDGKTIEVDKSECQVVEKGNRVSLLCGDNKMEIPEELRNAIEDL